MVSVGLLLWLTAFNIVSVFSFGLKEEFTWTRINYTWPGSALKHGHHRTSHFVFENDENDYIYENNIPIGATRWKDKMFITNPRRSPGIPSTLNYVSMNSSERHNVPLTPYPNWNANNLNTAPEQRLVSVYRIAVDSVCDRLWLTDTGILEYPGNRTVLQPHSIVVIDLKTDKIIRRYWIPPTQIRELTAITFTAVDVNPEKCDEAYAYLPDLTGFGLIVYSLKDNESWRIRHNYFYLESTHGDFEVAGIKYQWADGTFSVTLSERKADGFKDMFFQSMSGTNLFKVSTRILQNKSLATRTYHNDDFKIVGTRRPNQQSTGTALHAPSGIMFLGLVNLNTLACWNTNRPYSDDELDVIYRDDDNFIYPTDVKVNNEEIIVLTNIMPVFIYRKLDYNKVNFRVWMNSIEGAVQGTKCAKRNFNR